ncbi:MAG: hypothetical protein MZV70_49735 [Desulfobacterales bacterium]|nr:hypothetical protein [Desulfobacterales bacterium]
MALAAFREIIATGAITLYEKPIALFGAIVRAVQIPRRSAGGLRLSGPHAGRS